MRALRVPSVALAILMMSTLSWAGTISFDTSTPILSTKTDWDPGTHYLTFQQFDSLLGTLNSVGLYLSSDLSTILTVTNTGSTGSSGTAQTLLKVTVLDPGLYLTAPDLNLSSPSYGFSLTGGDSITSGTLTGTASTDNTYTSADILTEFTGPGTIALDTKTLTQTGILFSGANSAATQETYATLTGHVTYDYTPGSGVPEPTTFLMIGTALLGLGWFGQTKLRKR